jgi:chaperone modulatory protein CbpM
MSDALIEEGILLDESHEYTLTEFCTLCVIEKENVIDMVEYGILDPQGDAQAWVFNARAVVRTKKALRLHRDLAINWQGIALILDLLDEIQQLRALAAIQKHI